MTNKKEINKEKIDKASGGWSYVEKLNTTFKYEVGNHIEIKTVWFFYQFTDGGTIRARGLLNIVGKGHRPGYYIDGDSAGWYEEDVFDDDHRYGDYDVVARE